jgi:hypothetical protein
MKNMVFTGFVSSLLVIILLLAPAGPVFAFGAQSWNLDSHEDNQTLSPDWLCQMEQTGGPGDDGQSGEVVLEPSTTQIWIADQPATRKIVFGGGDGAWILELVTDVAWDTDGSDCVVEIGEWDPASFTFRAFGSASQDNPPIIAPIGGNQLIISFVWQDFIESIFAGRYLAISVTNDDNQAHTIYCGESEHSTCLTSTGYNPGYPTPHYPPSVPAFSPVGLFILIVSFPVLFAIRYRIRSHSNRS